jgi:SAM-dependent methyltransferase
MDPFLHYLGHGGYEGRDPGPTFSSSWYLRAYPDVKNAGTNPLIHYIRYGQREGRLPRPVESAPLQYKCPVCKNDVHEFLPLSPFYDQNFRKFGFPYTPYDFETLNVEQYSCPHCGTSDRCRLYACYLGEKIPQYPQGQTINILDIAPSAQLSQFIDCYQNVIHHTADLFAKDVDFVVDVTDMSAIASDSYDILICSHVLEHVVDDRKALSELYRVLKPSGWGIIMVPINLAIQQIEEDPQEADVSERWRRFGQDDHIRLYSKVGFIERVKAAGFKLRELGVDHFGISAFREYGITSKSVLYIAEKL